MRHAAPGLISVVVPAFNYARFLPQALDSALAQTGADLEVIVVDDGSIDETPEILRRYGPVIRALRQDNQGLPSARNAGASLAKGEFLVFLDADDLFPPGVLASQRDFLLDHPESGMAVCRSCFFEELDDGRHEEHGRWRLFLHDLDTHLCHFNIAPPHAVMIRRHALQAAGAFDTTLKACEDHDLWFRAALSGANPLANTEAEVAYRRHAGSMSRDLANQWLHDAVLHERIARALASMTIFPPKGRLEGLLACVAGCLLTAARLEPDRPDAARRLRGLATDTARRLARESPSPGRRPATLIYFALRTLLSLCEPLQTGEVWAMDIAQALERQFGNRGRRLAELGRPDIEALAERVAGKLT